MKLFFAMLILGNMLLAATINGIQIHSSTTGKGPKTVILVHGWTCDETTWKSQIPEISKNYRVITLDLPGHGQSGTPRDGELSLDLFARAIESVRSEASAEQVALVGHSMGTPVILHYAQLYPEHAAALVFVDGPVSPPRGGSGMLSFADQFAGPNGLKAREGMIRSMFSSATTQEMQKHILSMMLNAPAETAAGAMKAVMGSTSWHEGVFNRPVLGIYADKSQSANREYMKSHFPKMEYKEIPGTGHFLMLEKPEEFNRLLLEFLDRQNY
jgi:pimeloyl-ACP methyl ester carboxylesterase